MPHSTATSSTAVAETQQKSYIWTTTSNGDAHIRHLSNLERLFETFNRDLYGQNCPFLCASISVKRSAQSPLSPSLNVSQLQERAVEAFCQTRFRYPTVAARVVDGDKALYPVESAAEVKVWAERVVTTVTAGGGWLALRERLSRDEPIPTPAGDYCLMYLVVRPDEAESDEITTFDVLMHTHHVFIDGAGVRSVMQEFLSRIAAPLVAEEISWGTEVDKLFPPANLLVKEDEPEKEDSANKSQDSGVRLKGFGKPDIGLPVFRPELGPPKAELRGTQLVSYDFPATFLPRLLNAGRAHGVKLASTLHAALLQAVHDFCPSIELTEEDRYQSGSALDLRNGWMLSPWTDRKQYINAAVAIHPMEVSCSYFLKSPEPKSENEQFWSAAKFISNRWAEIVKEKNMVKRVEHDTGIFLENWEKNKASKGPKPAAAKPRTCPYFVSDPPGSQIMDSSFPFAGDDEMSLVLESYQMATDQNQAVISARSHSWNNKLTLTLVYNAARNPRDKMQEFLDTWVKIVEDICAEN